MGKTGGMGGMVTRRAEISDARELARLFTELGHPATEDDIRDCWTVWLASGNVGIVVDGPDGELVAAATLHETIVLHRKKRIGRISALVVDARHRNKGIGRAMVEAAEQMLRDSGCGMIEITSNMRRTEAHAFYARLGYELTSARFVKSLA